MSTEILQTNKNWLIWARKSAHFDKKTVANKMGINQKEIEEWENTGKITHKDLIKLSDIYHIAPFMFFNNNEPVYEKEISDFRTKNNAKVEINDKIVFEIRNAKNKRQTLLNLEEEHEDITIPDFKLKDYQCNDAGEASNTLIKILEISNAKRTTYKLEDWITKIEKLGILVFQFYNITPNDLRGYALYYDKLPIIGINHQESPESRKFTLFHELAHLLLKKEGLSNFNTYYLKKNIEVTCNAIAGEVLVPNTNIDLIVKEDNIINFTDANIINKLANRYKVSNEVIVRKFLINNYISPEDYTRYKEDLNKYIFSKNDKEITKKRKKSLKNQKPIKTNRDILKRDKSEASRFITQNGDYYTKALIYANKNEYITDLDFANYLDTSLNIVKLIIQKMNSRSRNHGES